MQIKSKQISNFTSRTKFATSKNHVASLDGTCKVLFILNYLQETKLIKYIGSNFKFNAIEQKQSNHCTTILCSKCPIQISF